MSDHRQTPTLCRKQRVSSANIGGGSPQFRRFCLSHVFGTGELSRPTWEATLAPVRVAHLIERGQAPGLWLSGQLTNVLVDYLLNGFGDLFGMRAAEKIVVPLCVLIFFWGLFRPATRRHGAPPGFMVPCLALVTYGWTFHMGFFNYYVSLGLAFFGVAILWRGKSWELLLVVALAPLIAVAHPFGLIWLAGAGVYVAIAKISSWRYQIGLFLACAASAGAHWYFWHRYIAEAPRGPFYFFSTARTSW